MQYTGPGKSTAQDPRKLRPVSGGWLDTSGRMAGYIRAFSGLPPTPKMMDTQHPPDFGGTFHAQTTILSENIGWFMFLPGSSGALHNGASGKGGKKAGGQEGTTARDRGRRTAGQGGKTGWSGGRNEEGTEE